MSAGGEQHSGYCPHGNPKRTHDYWCQACEIADLRSQLADREAECERWKAAAERYANLYAAARDLSDENKADHDRLAADNERLRAQVAGHAELLRDCLRALNGRFPKLAARIDAALAKQ